MFEEWSMLKQIKDEQNIFTPMYVLPSGEEFFVEPAFYTQLTNFKELYSVSDYERILKKMEDIVLTNKHVIFTYDFENPFVSKKGFIYLEFSDICDSLNIIVDDKSRGSDYGD